MSRRTWGQDVSTDALDTELQDLTRQARSWESLLKTSLWDLQDSLRGLDHLDGNDAGDVVHEREDSLWSRHFRHQEWQCWQNDRRFWSVVWTGLTDLNDTCWCAIEEIDEDALVWLPDDVEEQTVPEGHLPRGDVRHGVPQTFLDGLCSCDVCRVSVEVMDETAKAHWHHLRRFVRRWEEGVVDWGDE